MKTKPYAVGTLVASVLSTGLGYLWYMKLFKDMYSTEAAQAIMRPANEINPGLIFLSILIGALAIGIIYEKWAGTEHKTGAGFKLGALIGLIPGFGYAIMNYATSTMMTGQLVLVEAVYGIVNFGLIGATMAFVYSKMDK